MIEDREGLDALPEILATPGVDLLLEGSVDLSQSLGLPWQSRHPEVRQALCEMEAAARTAGLPYCAIPRAPEDIRFWWDRGVRTFVLGDERGIAFRALGAQLTRYQDVLPKQEDPLA
jgi:4-hydroxy-2-oxoheptanedioate aldolase